MLHKTDLLRICFLLGLHTKTSHGWYDVWRMSLNGNDWVLSDSTTKFMNIPQTVPGNAYTSLAKAKIADNPYDRFNDASLKWIAYNNWVFTKTVNLGFGDSHGFVDLVLHGVDTVSEVSLNGHVLGQTTNMFKRYVFPVGQHLKVGSNTISVTFASPIREAAARADAYSYVVPPTCPPDVQHGDCHVNFLRKEQASFSWDWGPSFPTVGIWRDVELQGYNSAIISYVTAETYPVQKDNYNGDWILRGRVYFDLGRDSPPRTVSGELVIEGLDQVSTNHYQMLTITTEKPYAEYKLTIERSSFDLWWPNGHGKQPLYDLGINFTSAEYGSEQSLYDLRVGFRTVEIVQETIHNSPGLSYYFKINGKPIFMKGSNWIPADSFQDRITDDYLKQLLSSAAEANMNMLRVWGGGVYESDKFYDLADELGLLIWQDMMFACALYPTNTEFLSDVKDEVIHQVRRLKHHPSIAVWAGNNENEGAISNKWYNMSGAPKGTYQADYRKLYVDTVRSAILAEDQSRPFQCSSPSNGLKSIQDNYITANVQDTHYGDVHYYNYDANTWDYSTSPTPRFASEYGIQSWCSLETLQPVSLASDLVMDSKFVEYRQHHGNGNQQMLKEIQMNLKLPNSADKQKEFKHFIYLSQINQAMGIKAETEHYRRMQSLVHNGEGMTMGALYWQLNDIWQAPTWASIEFGGKWKMLHYYAREFFQPVMLSPYLKNKTTVHLHLINESLPTMPRFKLDVRKDLYTLLKFRQYEKHFQLRQSLNYDAWARTRSGHINMAKNNNHNKPYSLTPSANLLNIDLFKWDNLKPVKTWKLELNQTGLASTEVFHMDIKQMIAGTSCLTMKQCFLYFTLPDHGISNWLFLSEPKDSMELAKKANLTLSNFSQKSSNEIQFTLTTDHIALFVWLDAPGFSGFFSNNGFLMVEKEMVLSYYSWKNISASQFANFHSKLTVHSLMDIY